VNQVNSQELKVIRAYADIYQEYAENTAFLWLLRSNAVTDPSYNADDIAELEQRIDAQLNGLMTSMEISWPVCEEALIYEEAGEVFTAAVIAFRSNDIEKIKIAVSAGLLDDDTFKGLVSAMGWLPDSIVQLWISKFFSSKDLDHKYLALAACSVRREDPGDMLIKILQRKDCLAQNNLYARSLRLIGELNRQDCMHYLKPAMESDNDAINFWANWSAILLGNKAAVNNISDRFSKESVYQEIFIQLAFRVVSIEQGRSWISDLVKNKTQLRAVIKAVGVLGDPHAVNWLITLMKEPVYARLAAEAFTNITGLELEEHQLSSEAPDYDTEDTIINSLEDLNESNIFMDEDENLPWPDVNKVIELWQKYGNNFIVGQLYFMGKTITAELLKSKIINATQRQRRNAALELALIDTDNNLINVCQRVLA